MPIPPVTAETLRNAMRRFDRDLRATPDWADWEQNRAHRYAIEHDGRRYPVKQVVSLATGVPVSDFSGGQAAGDANQYVASHGFAIVELGRRNPTWLRDELILALDLYLRYEGNPPPKGSPEIDELSKTSCSLFAAAPICTHYRGPHCEWPVALKGQNPLGNRNDRGSSSLELVAGKV